MVLAFLEYGALVLYDSDEDAAAAYDAVDVESEFVSFYRDDGTYLKPVVTVPNRYGRFLGLFRWSRSGTVRLVPELNTNEDPFWLALLEHPDLKPSHGFTTIDQLKQYLASKGAVVDRAHSER